MKVLFITYHFPPDEAVGGLRIEKFTRYLPSFGIKPFVLTVKDEYREGTDDTRVRNTNSTEVFKTSPLPGIRDIYLKLKGVHQGLQNAPVQAATTNDVHTEGLLRTIKHQFISLFIALPDDKKNWILPAAMKGIRLVKGVGIDCIFTSSPPHSIHLAGLIIKKMTGVKWAADFRDPWSDTLSYKPAHTGLSDKVETWMERKVIKNSDLIVTTTSPLAELYRQRYDLGSNEVVHIANGIDNEQFSTVNCTKKYDDFTITYLGTLYAGRSPEPVLKALRRLYDSGNIADGDIRLKLIGRCDYVDDRSISSMVDEYGLGDSVSVQKTVSYRDAILEMKRAHLLLLLAPGLPLQIPAKAYDYLGAGTRILCIADRSSATEELIVSSRAGLNFVPEDVTGIASYIYDEFRRWKDCDNRGSLSVDHLDAKVLAESLAKRLFFLSNNIGEMVEVADN